MNKKEADKMLMELYDATLVMYYFGGTGPEVVVKHKDILGIIKSFVSEDECTHCYGTGKLYMNHLPVMCPGCKDQS